MKTKTFYAVIPKEYTIDKMVSLVLGDTKEHAKFNWEEWNDGLKFEDVKKDWKVVKVEVKVV